MSTYLAMLIVLGLGIYTWLNGARAREFASSVVDELCRRRGYQLLDETVSLRRFGLVRTANGLHLKRLFQFDYSVEGVGRSRGHILLHGTRVMQVDIVEPDAELQTPTVEQPDSPAPSGKVVPFRRRD